MLQVLASAFIDELASIELEKLAIDISDPSRIPMITGAIESRWRRAGIEPSYINEALYGPVGMTSELNRIVAAGGAVGTPEYRAAQERVRDLARQYSKFAPGMKTVPTSGADRLIQRVKGEEPTLHRKAQRVAPKLTSSIGDTLRLKLGLPDKPMYAGEGALNAAAGALAPESDDVLKRSLKRRGNELIGAEAAKDISKGTGKGFIEAARKTLGPGLKAMPTPLKIGAGIGAGLLGKEVLFGDDHNKTTITVG